ncbi:MAG: hypothetical protein ACXADH_08410 [Candidatus Kariarchaeaceae archaeon]|jgi:hypothetical protein
MPGLTLLNIDRETDKSQTPIVEIKGIMEEISGFTEQIKPDASSARLFPLNMKLKQLQDAVSQFGSDGTIPVDTKQSAIMELHPDLQFLANELADYGADYFVSVEICMNFLLNHLCSSAAANPKSTVIGVSNVMAQVLSSGMQIVQISPISRDSADPKYFDEFAKIFNAMLTTAGLFAAPVLGLPDIPISALGGWADQALGQFAIINRFVSENFDPEIFYKIDKASNATPFDTTTDILSFYVYENEFLAALIARADLLSGLEFKITEDNEPITLQSIEEITELLASTIELNCTQIDRHLSKINEMYVYGKIDRNDNPSNHPHLMDYKTESKIWRIISNFAKLLVKIFEANIVNPDLSKINMIVRKDEPFPPIEWNKSELQNELYNTLVGLENSLFEMFPQAKVDVDNFVQSSDFTRFRDFLQYIITMVAANDILIQSEYAWTPWLLNRHAQYFSGPAIKHNPHGAMESGILAITLGLMTSTTNLQEEGLEKLNKAQPHLEFQMHHLLTIEVMNELLKNKYYDYKHTVLKISDAIIAFLGTNEINPNSMLFQRSNLFLAMLAMYKESETGEFLRKEEERFVAFDPFSWIQVPRRMNIPYMPLNTSIDNLSSG